MCPAPVMLTPLHESYPYSSLLSRFRYSFSKLFEQADKIADRATILQRPYPVECLLWIHPERTLRAQWLRWSLLKRHPNRTISCITYLMRFCN
jgi:hypothetical protein